MSIHAPSLFGTASLPSPQFVFSESGSRSRSEDAAESSGHAADLNDEIPVVFAAFDRSPASGSPDSSRSADRQSISLTLDNDKTKVPAVVESLLVACEAWNIIEETVRFKVCIALEEALLNAIVHGNLEVDSKLRELGDDSFEQLIEQRCSEAPFKDRRVNVECRLCRERATFVISDQGPGFDVGSVPDPTDPDYLERPCGRGMLLMRSFMDDVRYNDRGNCVTLVKNAPASQTSAEH